MRDRILHESKILIIDDDPRGIEILRRVLGAEGYAHTMAVTDPREAIEKFRSYVPDLIILDLIMPALNGLEVLGKLRAEGPAGNSVPVLVVTGDASAEAPREALQAGASDFITKPYDRSEIVLRVCNLLTTRFLHPEIQKQNELLEARVEERTRQLAAAREELEARVRERTEQLELANNALSTAGVVQKLGQEALRESESRYRAVYDENPLILVTVNSAGVIGSISRFGAQQLGYTPEELIGKPQSLLYHPDDQQIASDYLAECLRHSPRNGPIEVRKVRKDGSVLWARETIRVFRSEASKLALAVCEDITERKQMEEALRESEARYERVAANAPGMIYQFLRRPDGSMAFPYVSEGSRDLFALEPSEIMADANALIAKIDPADAASFARSVEEAISTRHEWHWEGRFTCPSGKLHWVQGASRPRRLPNGDTVWDGILMDITDRKKAEEAVRFQAHILDSIGEAVIATDPAGKIVYVNHCTEVMYGWPSAEMIGKNVLEIVPAGPSSEQAAEIMEKLRQGETWSGGFPVQRRDGTSFEARVVNTPLFDERGELIAIIGISSDITERKKSEEVLRESETRFRQMADSITDVFWMASTDGNETIYVSPAFEKIWGRPRQELYENPWLWAEAIHPDDRARVLATFEKMTLKKDYEEEYRVVRPDGSFRWVKDRGFPVRDADGKIYRVVGIAEDITERKRARDELNRFFNLSVDMLAIADFDGYLKQINPAWETTLGWTADELKSRPLLDFLHPDDRDKTLAEMEDLRLGRETIAFQNRYRGKDGAYKILSWNARADLSQRLFYATARDITQTRQIEDALRESEERFRSISDDVLDQAALGIVILDSDFRVVWANQTIGIFFGLERPDLIGFSKPRAIQDWLKNIFADPEEFASKVLATYENNTYRENFECEVLAGAARAHRWLQHSSQPIESGLYRGGRIEFYSDISYLKQAERAVRTAMAEADRANRAKSEFLSRMSHELRTPLNAILGFGELLDSSELEPEDAESVSQIVSAGRHLLTLINEVLDISGIEAGRLALSLEPVHLGGLVRETMTLLRPVAAARKVLLPDFACDLHVMADPQRLRQVILNLLSNAIKYNKMGGRVVLTAEDTENEMVRLKVGDTGAGISAEDLPKAFTPFARLGAASSDTEGIGLGLAISKRLVEMMGGAIGVESVAGEGSMFWIELPLAETFSPPASDGERPSIDDGKSKIENAVTLLYIEDNLSNLKLIERVIARRPGLKLVAATRGTIGLDLARTHQPDLILLDLHLPDVNGDRVLEELRADPRTAEIPVLIVSADATPDQIAKLKAAGARAYVTKPIDVPNFLALIDRIASESGWTETR